MHKMVFLRSKKHSKKSSKAAGNNNLEFDFPEKPTNHHPFGRSTSNGTTGTETDASSIGSDEQRERDLFLEADLNVKAASLLRGSALEDSVSVEESSFSSLEEGVALEPEPVHEISHEDPALEADDDVQFTEKDVYGQRHPIENPSLIANRLESFDAAVSKLPQKKRATLNQAMERCPELLNEGFKLKFLRCECFDVKRAANRYVKYWDRRLQVFGPEKAFLPLTMDGALKDDEVALSMGFLTLVRNKDASGRNILFADPAKQQFDLYTTESMIRAVWYIFHAALEDEETQKRGLVFLADLKAASLSLVDHELIKVVALSVTGCIPVRLSGIHGCFPPAVFWVIFPVIKLLLGERLGKRIKIHSGSKKKVHAGLIKYGLEADAHPTEIGGDLVLNNAAWLEDRRRAEQQL